MKVAVAASALAAVLGVGTTELPTWVMVIGALGGVGGIYKLVMADLDRRIKRAEVRFTEAQEKHTNVDSAQLVEKIQGTLMLRVDEQLEHMTVELNAERVKGEAQRVRVAELEVKLAHAETNLAEKDRRMDVMRMEIARLHDEIGRLLVGRDKTRRLDGDAQDEPHP